MKIVFVKSINFNGSKRFVGMVTRVTDGKGRDLIEKGIAEEYSGEYPPKSKVKTNLFKPKKSQ